MCRTEIVASVGYAFRFFGIGQELSEQPMWDHENCGIDFIGLHTIRGLGVLASEQRRPLYVRALSNSSKYFVDECIDVPNQIGLAHNDTPHSFADVELLPTEKLRNEAWWAMFAVGATAKEPVPDRMRASPYEARFASPNPVKYASGSVDAVKDDVLANVGPNLPMLDRYDRDVIEHVEHGSGQYEVVMILREGTLTTVGLDIIDNDNDGYFFPSVSFLLGFLTTFQFKLEFRMSWKCNILVAMWTVLPSRNIPNIRTKNCIGNIWLETSI